MLAGSILFFIVVRFIVAAVYRSNISKAVHIPYKTKTTPAEDVAFDL